MVVVVAVVVAMVVLVVAAAVVVVVVVVVGASGLVVKELFHAHTNFLVSHSVFVKKEVHSLHSAS